jgi:LysR family glycine cleavage system transcriptional activator
MSKPDALPPLAAIRVFESAARNLSFTRAAAELGMTQAAVSYQIKSLEVRLGSPLFLRRPRALALTEAGQWLAPRTTEAFDLLREAYGQFGERAQGTLTISTMHTFASQWLAPRLGAFQLTHPKLAVRLETTARVVDFAREEIDIAIRAGAGEWPGVVSTLLMRVQFTPMLSPKLAATIGGVKEPADLLKLPLIDPKDPWWAIWFSRNGLPLSGLEGREAVSLGLQALDAGAAMAGLGVAVLSPAFFAQDVADGRLLQPFDEVADAGNSYWLVYPESIRNTPKIKAFRDWIVGEAGRT